MLNNKQKYKLLKYISDYHNSRIENNNLVIYHKNYNTEDVLNKYYFDSKNSNNLDKYNISTTLKYNISSIDSTHILARYIVNKVCLKDYFKSSCGNSIVITATKQVAGIGTRNNIFVSPEGNLYLTAIYHTTKNFNYNILTCCVSYCIKKTVLDYIKYKFNDNKLYSYVDNSIKLKWINDLYYLKNNSKLGGILIDKIDDINDNNQNKFFFIISAGVNLNTKPCLSNINTENNPKIKTEATCLSEILTEFNYNYKSHLIDIDIFSDLANYNMELCMKDLLLNSNDNLYLNLIAENMLYLKENVIIVSSTNFNKILYNGKFEGLNNQGNAIILNKNNKYETACQGKMVKFEI